MFDYWNFDVGKSIQVLVLLKLVYSFERRRLETLKNSITKVIIFLKHLKLKLLLTEQPYLRDNPCIVSLESKGASKIIRRLLSLVENMSFFILNKVFKSNIS